MSLFKPLRYLIGVSRVPDGIENAITEVPWDCDTVPSAGEAIAYCNLLDENYADERKYDPYARQTGTAGDYNEGLIDWKGEGYLKNLEDQFKRRKASGFRYVELDNPDSYPLGAVLQAVNLAATFELKVIAKNPGLGCSDQDADLVVAHANVFGIIVEKGAGSPASMDAMRRINGKPDLPTWFVNFGPGAEDKAHHQHEQAQKFKSQWVSYSTRGEYGNAVLL